MEVFKRCWEKNKRWDDFEQCLFLMDIVIVSDIDKAKMNVNGAIYDNPNFKKGNENAK